MLRYIPEDLLDAVAALQVRASTRNVWEASGRLSVEDVKALLLKAGNSNGKGAGPWPAAGLDSKTAR
jgi:hypothetical protein